jgi:hypothetical protein
VPGILLPLAAAATALTCRSHGVRLPLRALISDALCVLTI